MADAGIENVETQARRAIFVAVATAFLGLAWPAALALRDPLPRLRHPAIIDSAYFAFALWAGASLLIVQVPGGEWKPGSVRLRAVRWAWASAWLLFAVHVGYAFHFAHGWSHAKAVGHVQTTSGFGLGIFVSYAFALIWLADVLWLLVAGSSYTSRPRLLGWSSHGFFALIAFNGTVVYGHGLMRWVCLAVFAVLAVELVLKLYISPKRDTHAPR